MKSVYSRIVLEVMVPSDWSVDHIGEHGIHDPLKPNEPNKIHQAVENAKTKLAEDLQTIHPDIEVR